MASEGPNWLPDPSRRFQVRYWDGASWTDYVATNGQASIDPSDPTWAPPSAPPPPPPLPPPLAGAPQSAQPVVYVSQGPRTNGLAIASMVLGIVWVYWVGSILAVIFGHVALSQIKRSQGAQRGSGMAIAGLVLGYIGIAVLAVVIVVAAFGGFDSSSGGSYSVSCSVDKVVLETAEEAYFAKTGGYGTESQLVGAGFLRNESGLHDVVLSAGRTNYALTPTGSNCVS
jgi:hypothetical protein